MITRLPFNGDNTSWSHLIVLVRDRFDGVTEMSLSSVLIETDTSVVNSLIDGLIDGSLNSLNNYAVVQLLSSGSQNTICSILASISGIVNKMNVENVNQAVKSSHFFLL